MKPSFGEDKQLKMNKSQASLLLPSRRSPNSRMLSQTPRINESPSGYASHAECLKKPLDTPFCSNKKTVNRRNAKDQRKAMRRMHNAKPSNIMNSTVTSRSRPGNQIQMHQSVSSLPNEKHQNSTASFNKKPRKVTPPPPIKPEVKTIQVQRNIVIRPVHEMQNEMEPGPQSLLSPTPGGFASPLGMTEQREPTPTLPDYEQEV